MSRRFSKLMTFVLAICLLASLMTAGAFADENDTIIERALATSDKEAVVMRTAGEIAFTTSTTGASVSSVVWTDANGTAVGASDAFRQEVYTLTVTLTAGDGYVFAQNCSGYLYGKSCSIAVRSSRPSGRAGVLCLLGHLCHLQPVVFRQPGRERNPDGQGCRGAFLRDPHRR